MQNPSNPSDPEWTIIKLLTWTTSYFKSHKIDSPRTTAEVLLAHVLMIKRIDLYLRYDQPLCQEELLRFKTLIKRRVKREPLAYIVGKKEFWSMDFSVTTDVLIPRPETEFLVEAALKLLQKDSTTGRSPEKKRVLDLGTGCGAVILALASIGLDHHFFASERNIAAIEVARQNAADHGLDHRVHFFCADWLSAFGDGKSIFDVILSNPPYIPSRVIAELQPEIRLYEPISALDGGEDGLTCLKHLIHVAHLYLCGNGSLLLEIGHDQKEDVIRMINQCGSYEKIVITKDYSGYDRVVQVRKK